MRYSKKLCWGLLGLALFSILIRVPFMNVPMITDEGGCAYVALFWSSDHQLYRDINYDRLQGLFLIYKGILAFLGHEIASIRLGAAIFNVGTVLAVFFLAKMLFSEFSGWLAGLFVAIFSAAPAIEGFTANSEVFAVFPLTIAAIMAWKKRWYLAGLFAGISVLFKPIGISGLLLTLIWIIVTREKWCSALMAGLGFAIGPALAAFHGWMIGWQYFWGTFVTHRALAFSLFSGQAAAQFKNFLVSVGATYQAWIVLAVLSIVTMIYLPVRVRHFSLIWIICSVLGMAIGGNWFPHYYIQIIPPLAVIAGIGASHIISMGGRTKALWLTALAISSGIFLLNQLPFWLMSSEEISIGIYQRPAYLISKEVGEYINNNTDANDSIYVAFGQAEIYYYARRKAAVPQQLYWHQIESNRDLWGKVIMSIRAKAPAMIVWVQYLPPRQWSTPEAFKALIEKGYYLDRKLLPLSIYKRR